MTREGLHELVWSQPMQTIAKSMGISDVALAKQCRRADVPVPPRGWWAKKAAGRLVRVQPLAPSPFVLRNYFPAVDLEKTPTEPNGNPVKPIFRDLTIVSKEIEEAVCSVRIPKDLSHPHPIVVRLLQQDEGRKKEQNGKGWMSDFWGPKFVTAIQQRRLRLLTGLFRELERLGCKISGSTHAGEKFSVSVGSRWAYIECYVQAEPAREFGRQPKERAEWLRFDITEHDPDRGKPKKSWTESEAKLEAQASDIVRVFLLQVEQEARSGSLASYEWAVADRLRREREAKLAAERAEAERVAREQAAKDAQVKALTEGTNAFEMAGRIRRYVTSVKERYGATRSEEVDRWAKWALEKADELDPLASGRFFTETDFC